jgi:hypothetical protein
VAGEDVNAPDTITVTLLDGTSIEIPVDEILCIMPRVAWPEGERGQG